MTTNEFSPCRNAFTARLRESGWHLKARDEVDRLHYAAYDAKIHDQYYSVTNRLFNETVLVGTIPHSAQGQEQLIEKIKYTCMSAKKNRDMFFTAYGVHHGATDQLSATKHDDNKPRTDLLDADFMLGLAAVLTDGATKYGDNNWRKGMAFSRAYAALLRHLFAFWNGYDNDAESGLPHLDHAAAELMFLRTYATHEAYKNNDDRPPRSLEDTTSEHSTF